MPTFRTEFLYSREICFDDFCSRLLFALYEHISNKSQTLAGLMWYSFKMSTNVNKTFDLDLTHDALRML